MSKLTSNTKIFTRQTSVHVILCLLYRKFVSGVGGTGKSFLIEAIKAMVNSLWSSEGLLCGVAAPTGLAAFEVASPFHIQTAVFTSDNPVNILGRRGWVEVASPFCNNTTLKLQQILI